MQWEEKATQGRIIKWSENNILKESQVPQVKIFLFCHLCSCGRSPFLVGNLKQRQKVHQTWGGNMVMQRTVNMVAAVSMDVVGTEGSDTNYFITILTSVRLSWQSYSPR